MSHGARPKEYGGCSKGNLLRLHKHQMYVMERGHEEDEHA